MKKQNQQIKIIFTLALLTTVVACGGGGGGGSSSGGPDKTATSIVPLTCLNEVELPALAGGGKMKVESGSKGSVKMDCKTIQYSIDGASMNVSDLKREHTMNIACTSPKKKNVTIVWKSDYKTGVSTWSWKNEKGKGLKCTEKYNSPLSTTIASTDSIAKLLLEWGTDDYASKADFISSDCPKDGVQSEEVGGLNCTVDMLSNFTISDDKGKVHKLATRMGLPIKKMDGSGGGSGGSGSGDFSSVALTGTAAASLGITEFVPRKIEDVTTTVIPTTMLRWFQESGATQYQLAVNIQKLGGVEKITSQFHESKLENGVFVLKKIWVNSMFSGDVNADDVEFRDTSFSDGMTELIINGTLKRKK